MSSPLKVTLSRGPPDHVPSPEHSFSRGATPISCLLESLQVLSPREGISFLFFQLKSQPCFCSLGWEFVFSQNGFDFSFITLICLQGRTCCQVWGCKQAVSSCRFPQSQSQLPGPVPPKVVPLSGHPHLVAR